MKLFVKLLPLPYLFMPALKALYEAAYITMSVVQSHLTADCELVYEFSKCQVGFYILFPLDCM